MKTKIKFQLFALFISAGTYVFGQPCGSPPAIPCGMNFDNGLYCSQTVDISWYWIDCFNSPCGGGSAIGIPAGSSVPLTCTPAPCGPCYLDLVITVTAVNGCSITPVSLSWTQACASPTQPGAAAIPCPCPPSSTGCCDFGTSLLIWPYLGQCGVN